MGEIFTAEDLEREAAVCHLEISMLKRSQTDGSYARWERAALMMSARISYLAHLEHALSVLGRKPN